MAQKTKRGLTVEWYIISKKSIYTFIGGILCFVALGIGIWWIYQKTTKVLNEPAAFGKKSARFIQIEGKVRVKRANETEFKNASEEMSLEAGDTIQTMAESAARVQFVDGSSYTIKADTTLVIKDNSLNNDNSTRVQVAVGIGRINLATGDQSPGSSNIVQTNSVSAAIGSQTEASVATNDKGENTEIQVARGSARINTETGQSYEAKQNEQLGFGGKGELVTRKMMVPVPDLSTPGNQQVLKVPTSRSGRVLFNWNGVPQAESYRIEVATSAYFDKTVVATQDNLKSTEAAIDNLQPGIYYWHVRANSAKEGAGQFSAPYKFSLVSGAASRPINISVTKQTPLGGDIYKIEGKSEPGTRVKVGNTVAGVTADGSFSALVTLSGGNREILIEAQDQDGNTGRKKVRL